MEIDRSTPTDIPLDGIDFEHWCADQLRIQGWQASVSKASGDQGVDIVVERNGFRVAVQCKRYSKPVGNKAIQEIFAGQRNVMADAAAVIGTGGYTRSAVELSNATNVKIFDVSEIEYFTERFDHKGSRACSPHATERSDVSPLLEDRLSINDNFVKMKFKTDAEKCIAKSYFKVIDQCLDSVSSAVVDELNRGVEKNTGSGKIRLSRNDFAEFLHVANLYLSSEVSFTEDIRNQMLNSDEIWQVDLGKNSSLKTIFGCETFGKAKPNELHDTFFLMTVLSEVWLEYSYKFVDIFDEEIADVRGSAWLID